MGLLDRFKRTSNDPQERFWAWFQHNKDRVAGMFTDRERGAAAYGELTRELQRVHAAMVPELMRDADGTCVLVISADGAREGVGPVIQLAEAAPDIAGWRVERFRRPAPEGFRLNYQGLDLDPAHLRVAYSVDERAEMVHVGLVIPGYQAEDERYRASAFLYLDHTIGEYNTIMHIGGIDLLEPDDVPPDLELLTLTGLRLLIEERFY